MTRTRQLAEFSIYTALAFIFGYIESLIPLPVPFPGMKIGLANLIIIIVLYKKDFRSAFCISMLRNFLNAFTFGSMFSLLYSLAGSILSVAVMGFIKRFGSRRFSVFSASILGGILHNMGQLLVASFLVGFSSILWYLPVLYFCGLLTGSIIGWIAARCLRSIVLFRFFNT